MLDAVLHQGLGVVDKEVILHDGIDAKAMALVIGKLVAEAAGAELDAAYPFLGQAGQNEAQQAGADALLLAATAILKSSAVCSPTRLATQAPTTSLPARVANPQVPGR